MLPLILCAGLPLAAAFAVGLAELDLVAMLFRDPAASTNSPPYLGFFSQLAVLGWWAGAVSSLLAATVLPRSRARFVLLSAGALTGLLTLDDLFMLHEEVLPHLGLPERFVYAFYCIALAAYLLGCKSFHRSMDWPLLLASFALLGTSVAVDLVADFGRYTLLIEDGTKFAGITAWSGYHALAARRCLLRELALSSR
jgi:hypothetical protein